jgi:hypothetical protein
MPNFASSKYTLKNEALQQKELFSLACSKVEEVHEITAAA